MSNAEHYDLERRLIERIWAADEKELRTAIVRHVSNASVSTVEDMATLLGVQRRKTTLGDAVKAARGGPTPPRSSQGFA